MEENNINMHKNNELLSEIVLNKYFSLHCL